MMKKVLTMVLGLFLIMTSIFLSGPDAAEKDREGSKDHPLLTRMNGFYIADYEDHDFGSYQFWDKSGKKTPIEGHLYKLRYRLNKGAAAPGELKIRRNIQEAVKKIGGTVIFDHDMNRTSTMVVKKAKKETWIEVRSSSNGYLLTIVEREAMEQEVVADAAAMGNDLRATGHIAVYGIYFDTGKSEIKPQSDAALGEIAKLLTNEAALELYVVGHTDNVGSLDSNMRLSRDRADAVVKALSGKHGISAARMKAHGIASLSPVASNDTEEGKAKNRRVELVKQ